MKQLITVATSFALAASTGVPALASSIHSASRAVIFNGRSLAVSRSPYLPTQRLERLGARYLGHAAIGRMTVDVQTPMRNAAALKTYATESNTPGSHYYRHWLTPSELGDAFGTPAASYAATEKYFASFGMAVKGWPTRNLVTITGSGDMMERALGTTFGRFSIRLRDSRRSALFNAPMTTPTIDNVMPGLATSKLVSLDTRLLTFMTTSPPEAISAGFANSRVNGASPAQLAEAYDYAGAYEAGFTGKGINIGIIGTGPISANDVPNMRKIYNVPGSSTVTIIPATINGDSTPPPVTGPCAATTLGGVSPVGDPTSGSSTSPTTGCDPEDIEAQLDTEQTSLLAYDASVRFYLAYNGSGCFVEADPVLGGCVGPDSTSQGLDLTDDEIMTAIADDQADILSLSYAACEILDTALMSNMANPGGDATGTDPTEFQELASEGIAVFASSGDSGSAGCQRNVGGSDAPNIGYPSSDPNVVAVGGTTTPMGPDGRLTGPITTWGEQTESGGAEGAGTSIEFQTPSYQKGILAACTMRCVPDVVLDADPYSGAAVVYDTGLSGGALEVPVGGTSQAAPDMAAMWALVLSACKVTPTCGGGYGSNVVDPPSGYTAPAAPAYRLGNPNFLWYKLAAASAATQYHDTFYDVVYGNDAVPPYAAIEAAGVSSGEGVNVSAYSGGTDPGSVNAGPGVDEATGLGAPFARALIKYVVGV